MKIPIIICLISFALTLSAQEEDPIIIDTIQFRSGLSFANNAKVDIPIKANWQLIENEFQLSAVQGDVLINFDLPKYRKGYYEIRALKIGDKYDQFQILPELVEGLGKQLENEVAIKILNGADNANIKFLEDPATYQFVLIKRPYIPVRGKALGIFEVKAYCNQAPKLKLGASIFQGLALVGGGYLLGKGITDKNKAQTTYTDNYINVGPPEGVVSSSYRNGRASIRDQVVSDDEKATNKINLGIILLSANALWSIHRFSTHRKRKELYKSNQCEKERSLSFQPYLETNNPWLEQPPVGLTLIYTFNKNRK